jgi:TfoX/Sxy family transcriptional regulator of competence genes
VDVKPLFDEAAERMLARHADVQGGRMFASDGLKTGDRFFAIVAQGDLVLKLPADRVEELIATAGAAPFEVGKRRMREWLRIAPADARECESLMTEARDFVRG